MKIWQDSVCVCVYLDIYLYVCLYQLIQDGMYAMCWNTYWHSVFHIIPWLKLQHSQTFEGTEPQCWDSTSYEPRKNILYLC